MRKSQRNAPGACDEQENRLNAEALRWKESSLSDEERSTLRNTLFLLSFELYDDHSDAFLNSVLEALQKYDPEKGPFSHYLKYLISRRNTDAYRKQRNHAPNADSLDAAISEENTLSLEDVVSDRMAEDPGQIGRLEGKLADLTAMILNFSQRHAGKADNATRRSWYRMFYTENMTLVAKEEVRTLLHERDVFTAMELEYLDYYMTKACRSLRTLGAARLKPYHEVVPERESMEDTPVPLPADVSLAFWQYCRGEKKGASARSEQYKAYKQELEQLES